MLSRAHCLGPHYQFSQGLVFRAPPEGPLARWERCWRRPGPAALLPSPSTGCQAQRVPLASRAWQWGCLHSQRRVWTGQGAATSCWSHTCRKANFSTQREDTHKHPHTCRHTHFHGTNSWRVWHMFGSCCRSENEGVKEVCAGEKHHRQRLQRLQKYSVLFRIIGNIWVAFLLHHGLLTMECRTNNPRIDSKFCLCRGGLNLKKFKIISKCSWVFYHPPLSSLMQ